ncbi:MAG: hypothetical protein ACUVXA_14545, partial [Candidatus Jordarchaeum sp.]|uniref:hypothetical protein n=1 Tax=Candidatus Jordarchaeum sp. TaxID=2823881 RepID=UPI0040498A19
VQEWYYLSLNLSTVVNPKQQTKTSDLDISASLNFSTNLDIEALTPDQIKLYKQNIEDVVNNAFMKWQMQKMKSGELNPFTSQPDNESVRALFFQFLSEKPDCAARFAQYDQMLSRENQLRISEQVSELKQSLQDIKLIIEQGEIISELNETRNINGTNYYIITREYSLTINGTTQNVIKITVTTDDGTVILDPYFRIDRALLLWPCYVWVFWPFVFVGWWYTVILYGYDWYMYTFYTPGLEASAWINHVYWSLPLAHLDSLSWAGIVSGFAGGLYGIGQGALSATLAAAVGTALSALSVALMAALIIGVVYQSHVLDSYEEVAAYNLARDPYWGWMECDYFHNPISPPTTANPPCFDSQNKIVPYLVTVDGAFWRKLPPPDWFITPGDAMYTSYINLITVFGSLFGFGNWVWLG